MPNSLKAREGPYDGLYLCGRNWDGFETLATVVIRSTPVQVLKYRKLPLPPFGPVRDDIAGELISYETALSRRIGFAD